MNNVKKTNDEKHFFFFYLSPDIISLYYIYYYSSYLCLCKWSIYHTTKHFRTATYLWQYYSAWYVEEPEIKTNWIAGILWLKLNMILRCIWPPYQHILIVVIKKWWMIINKVILLYIYSVQQENAQCTDQNRFMFAHIPHRSPDGTLRKEKLGYGSHLVISLQCA